MESHSVFIDKLLALIAQLDGELELIRHEMVLCRIKYLQNKLEILLQCKQEQNDTYSAISEKYKDNSIGADF